MMKVKNLFDLYDSKITTNPNIENIFSYAGMSNEYAQLDFGFFPLGSGILQNDKSKIDEAEIAFCKVLVLGNDFGTKHYVNNKCPNKKEKASNSTIRNLVKSDGLNLDLETTFFTNLHLGLIKEGSNTYRKTKLKEDYKKVCFDFFKIQLDFVDPKIVLCLGEDVRKSLSEFSDIFSNFSLLNNIINTKDTFWGNRKFILIPHPSMAHFNWKNGMKNKIISSLQV